MCWWSRSRTLAGQNSQLLWQSCSSAPSLASSRRIIAASSDSHLFTNYILIAQNLPATWQRASPAMPFILTQGSKLGLLLCRQILYHLSHREAQRLIQSSFNSFAHFCAPGFQTEPAPICGCQDCPRYFTPCIHGCPVLRSLQDAPSKAMVFIIMPSGNTSLM